jgi:hypothetical protein
MITNINDAYRRHNAFDDSPEFETFERFNYRRGGEFPVRSQAARTRGRLRSRGGVAARHKAAAFNGVIRRGSRRTWR